MSASRWARAVFPWAKLQGEVGAGWVWGFRAAWLLGVFIWACAPERTPRGLLSVLGLFFLVGNSLNPERAIKSSALEPAAVFAFSLLFINGIVAFAPAKTLMALLAGQVVAARASVYCAALSLAAAVFALMWLMLLRHSRARSGCHGPPL